MADLRIAIIGAGLAGLSCAQRLGQAGQKVQCFDKARGPGGRMSTRRVDTPLGEASFDHGTQYLRATTPEFAAQLAEWESRGIVARWPQVSATAYVGTPAMNAPVKALAAGRDSVWNSRITAIKHLQAGWEITDGEGTSRWDALVLAIPPEQAATLLEPIHAEFAALAGNVQSAPCWTVMAAFDALLPHQPDWIRDQGIIGWAARNSAKPGRSGPEAWVIQGNAEWSARTIEDDPQWIAQQLLDALGTAIGAILPEPMVMQAHRWRYAQAPGIGQAALWQADTRLGVCGDWLLGPKAEHGWLSGQALAEQMIADFGA